MNALLLAGLSLAGLLTAPLLLLLTFSNGIGLALRWPVFAAIVPQTVTRELLPQALALNGIAMNLSRVVGPVLAGLLIATVSPAAVFVLNALLAGVAFTLILRWRGEPVRPARCPGERFVGAMRAGLNYAWQSPRLKVVLLRIFLFFLQSTALVALAAAGGAQLHGGGPGTFTVMLSCLGAGAIIAALVLSALARPLQPRPVRHHRHAGACGAVDADRRRARDLGRAAGDGASSAWPGSRWPIRSSSRRRRRCPTGCARAACRSTRWR